MLKERRARDSGSLISARLLENLAPNQHASDLARPCPDFVELGIPQKSASRKVVDITVAAKALDRLEGHPGRALCRIQDCAGRILARGASLIAGTRDHVYVRLRGIH